MGHYRAGSISIALRERNKRSCWTSDGDVQHAEQQRPACRTTVWTGGIEAVPLCNLVCTASTQDDAASLCCRTVGHMYKEGFLLRGVFGRAPLATAVPTLPLVRTGSDWYWWSESSSANRLFAYGDKNAVENIRLGYLAGIFITDATMNVARLLNASLLWSYVSQISECLAIYNNC